MPTNDDVRINIKRVSLEWEKGGAKSFLEFPCTLSESHSVDTQFTEHTIEDGSVITDHVRPGLDQLDITAVVSNKPVDPLVRNEIAEGYNNVISATVDPSPGRDNYLTEDVDFVFLIFNQLRQLSREGTIISNVGTSLRNYGSMVVTNVSAPRDMANSYSTQMDITFRQVELVTLQVEDGNIPTVPRGNMQQSTNRPTTNANASEEERANQAAQAF